MYVKRTTVLLTSFLARTWWRYPVPKNCYRDGSVVLQLLLYSTTRGALKKRKNNILYHNNHERNSFSCLQPHTQSNCSKIQNLQFENPSYHYHYHLAPRRSKILRISPHQTASSISLRTGKQPSVIPFSRQFFTHDTHSHHNNTS